MLCDEQISDKVREHFVQYVLVMDLKSYTHQCHILLLFQIEGLGSFIVPIEEISEYTDRLPGTVIDVTATVMDVQSLQTRSETTQTVIKDRSIYVEFLGGPVRTFKPGVPFVVYVSDIHELK